MSKIRTVAMFVIVDLLTKFNRNLQSASNVP